ncbi:MAG: class I SAM-dependent methyltransferase [Candidatus Methylomirabilia bacterium]
MDPYGKREVLDLFGRQLRQHGDHPQAVRWTARGQLARYEAFLAVCGDLTGKSVLDFGCGKGDLCGFLRERGVSCAYTGVDLHPDLIALAKRKHPGAQFVARDIEEEPLGMTFDVVVACGVFNLRVGGIQQTVEAVLPLLFACAREALHANFLTARAPGHDVELHYVDPAWLLGFARRHLAPEAAVREDLVPDDVFLAVRR